MGTVKSKNEKVLNKSEVSRKTTDKEMSMVKKNGLSLDHAKSDNSYVG